MLAPGVTYRMITRVGVLSKASGKSRNRGTRQLIAEWLCLRTTSSSCRSVSRHGVWGPAARGFFNECLKLADSDRNVDLYHWSSTKFSSTWYDTLSVLVAKGRAKVSVAASEADWSKRIREMQYADYEDHTTGS